MSISRRLSFAKIERDGNAELIRIRPEKIVRFTDTGCRFSLQKISCRINGIRTFVMAWKLL
jgi:hypothetical protein